jgi:hypothetical protein
VAELDLNTSKKQPTTELALNLTDTDSGEKRTVRYAVTRLGGRQLLENQIRLAELAKEKDRNVLVGSLLFRDIVDRVSPVGDAPQLMDMVDELGDEAFAQLSKALLEAATGSSVDG